MSEDLAEQGLDRYWEGDVDGAEKLAQQALQHDSNDAEALHLMGLIAIAREDGPKAIDYLSRATEAAPNESEFHNNLGVALRAMNHPDESEKAFARASELDPANGQAHANLAAALQSKADYPAAEQAYRKAIEASEASAPLLIRFGEVLAHQQKIREALQAWQQAAALDPAIPEAHLYTGYALSNLKHYREAIQSFAAASQAAPNDPRPHWLAGAILHSLKQFDEAINHYHAAITLDPNCEPAWQRLTECLSARGQHDQAIQAGRHAIQLSPDSPYANYALAVAFERAGRTKEAAVFFRTAARLDPDAARWKYDAAAVGGSADAPSATPPDFIKAVFGEYAPTFEKHLVEVLQYRAPQQLIDALTAAGAAGPFENVLDLGCGTGLVGSLIKPRARRLTGVDLVPEMLARARERNVYDELIEEEVTTFLRRSPDRTFDLILAADVFIYIGDLAQIFAQTKRILRHNGYFAFSLEAQDEPGFKLRPSRRYTHNIDYIRKLATQHTLVESIVQRVVLRMENEREVAGWVVALRKP